MPYARLNSHTSIPAHVGRSGSSSSSSLGQEGLQTGIYVPPSFLNLYFSFFRGRISRLHSAHITSSTINEIARRQSVRHPPVQQAVQPFGCPY